MSMYVLKTVIAGEGGIGKTSLVRSFMNEVMANDYKMTIGVDISSKTIQIDKKSITFSVHDLAGQNRFAESKVLFMKGTQLALLVFDLTRKDTLTNLLNKWIPPLLELNPNIICILIGNKSDLVDLRVFGQTEGQDTLKNLQKKYSKEHFIQYIETSALQNLNVNQSFITLGKKYLNIKK